MRNSLNLVFVIMIFMVLGCVCGRNNRQTPTVDSSTPNPNTVATSPTPTLVPSSAKTPKENLELGKKALSEGDLSTARNHLSAIPKDAKEYASAKQYLATVEKREQRKKIEDELESVKRDEAGQEDILNRTENMEGSIGRNIYANALKRKAALQLQRIKLERKLKSMP